MIDLKKLWFAMPQDLQRKISCHDLKRIVDNYNGPDTDALLSACRSTEMMMHKLISGSEVCQIEANDLWNEARAAIALASESQREDAETADEKSDGQAENATAMASADTQTPPKETTL